MTTREEELNDLTKILTSSLKAIVPILDDEDLSTFIEYINESFELVGYKVTALFVPPKIWDKYKEIYSNDKQKIINLCEDINKTIGYLQPILERYRVLIFK